MNENQAVLAHLLKIGVNGFDSFWSIVDNSDDEDNFMHLLAYRVTTVFDLLNQLGGLGVVFDISYVLCLNLRVWHRILTDFQRRTYRNRNTCHS
ncbi:hypothetical protein C6Y10_11325 [Lactiplantibacillus pentosus]|uniref:hypothetical protein n=1 Tax=Lactiplantibacillus pentosus TaxID=1589 RepID=UPI000D01D438|nr:hypothetical protein [Lactiplantibacillus pentosus]PRO83398.1 hypothetical protein C6Y10_11325 [Lactiplantibacillus pentosus]